MKEYSRNARPSHRVVVARITMLAVLGLVGFATQPRAQSEIPAVRFHVGAPELLDMVYAGRYQADPRARDADAEWVRDNAADLVAWWGRDGLPFLQRVTDYAGLTWPYRDIEVYVVRYWPTVSIERPLVVALDAIRAGGQDVEVPDDPDVRILLVAHQLTHYLLDRPDYEPRGLIDATYDHPFLQPGNYDLEAMVNWVVYRALEDVWGRERLDAATADELWEIYNPNHDYVVDELEPRHRLSRRRPLAEWLATTPAESEIFRIRDAYVLQSDEPPPAIVDRDRISGTDYGVDLGASYDGRIFIAYVDRDSPSARVGLEQGDIVRTIEGREVADVVEAQSRMDDSWADNGEINLSVERGGQEFFFSIEAP